MKNLPLRPLAALFLVVLAGCSRHAEPPAAETENGTAPAAATARSARAASADPGIPVPAEEPSEAVLDDLVREWYDEAEAGGALTFADSSGRKKRLNPKIYSVRKEECKRVPKSPEGHYECSLLLSLSIMGDAPADHPQRMSVNWDGKSGKWIR